jgi:GPH family glycoside/pentoside/hexuronide:cation symporter
MLSVGYRNTNIILGIVVIIIMTICVASIEEINPPLIVKREKSATGGLLDDLKEVLSYKPFVLMLIVILFLFWAYYLMFGAIQYFFTYVVGDVSKMSLATSLMTITPIFTQLLTPSLNQRFSKRNLMIGGSVIDLVAVTGLFFCYSNVTLVYAFVVLFGLGMGIRMVVYYSMLADCVDYGEWKTGRSLAGTQGAVNGFTGKIASALASASMSYLLVWGGYEATATVQTTKALFGIRFGFAGASIIATAICIFVMLFYDLDKKYPQIKADLDAKRRANERN